MKKVRVVFSLESEIVYKNLSEENNFFKDKKMIFDSINNKISLIKLNTHYGNPIAKKLIPNEYKIKFNISNLFRVELSLFWRMLYTITNNNSEVIVFILDIVNNKDYNKKFAYSKK